MEKKRRMELFGEFVDFMKKKRKRRDSGSSSLASVDWPVEYLESDESDYEIPEKESDVGEEAEVKKEESVIIEDDIDDEILKLLGEEGGEQSLHTPKIHEQLAKRWANIIQKGMDKEEKSKIMKKYPPIENMPMLVTPKLNPELDVAMSEGARKRDKNVTAQQQQIAVAVSALGGLLSTLVSRTRKVESNEIVETISNASRILCDLFGIENRRRRFLALEGLNKEMKLSLQRRDIGEFLFGNNLGDGIKTVKAVAKAAKELKEKPKSLNSLGPLRTRRRGQYSSRQSFPGSSNIQGFRGTGRGPAAKRNFPAPSTQKRGNHQGATLRVQTQSGGARPRR